MDDKVYDEVRVCELVTSWLWDGQPLHETAQSEYIGICGEIRVQRIMC